MSEAPVVVDVSERDFQVAVLEESFRRPVIVDFWADWCAPCRVLGPLLEELVGERGGAVLLARVNIDEDQRLARSFRISAVPAVRVLIEGQLVADFDGVLPEEDLRSLLDQLAPGTAGGGKRRADTEARDLRDPVAAEKQYRQQIAEQADAIEPRLGLARLLLAQGKTEEIAELLAPVGVEGEQGAEAERILAQVYFLEKTKGLPDEATLRKQVAADEKAALPRYQLGLVLAKKGDYRGALEALLPAGERDYAMAGKEVREAMVKVFYIVGVNDALANEYRTKLARLLY